MRNTKNAFTLVELIVVITILAILGTIAFISLQGYSADARNSKRTSDLGNIQSAISLKQVEGVPLMSFVTTSATAVITTPALGGVADASAKYDAGTPAYTVLNVAEKDFKDPTDKAYRIGATTLRGSVFQIAASIEVDGTDTALVNGTFPKARLAASTYTGSIDQNIMSLSDDAANIFKAGDTVNVTGAGAPQNGLIINKVSRDGVTVTLSADINTGNDTIALAADEDAGLIAATRSGNGTAFTANETVVINDSPNALAY